MVATFSLWLLPLPQAHLAIPRTEPRLAQLKDIVDFYLIWAAFLVGVPCWKWMTLCGSTWPQMLEFFSWFFPFESEINPSHYKFKIKARKAPNPFIYMLLVATKDPVFCLGSEKWLGFRVSGI